MQLFGGEGEQLLKLEGQQELLKLQELYENGPQGTQQMQQRGFHIYGNYAILILLITKMTQYSEK